MNRTWVLFGGIAALVITGAVVFRPDAHAETPRLPHDDAEVVARVPRRDDAERARRALARDLAAHPGDLGEALRVARSDVERARATGDPRYLGQAEAALAPWWDAAAPPVPALVLRATIEQSLHDFDAALIDLDAAVARAPEDPQAWLTRSVVLSVRGRFAEARQSCTPLRQLTPGLVAVMCEASIDGLTGDAQGASDRIRVAMQDSRDEGLRAWALSNLAELAVRLGRVDEARTLFERTLAMDPGDAYARAAYADLLLDEGHPGEVLGLLRDGADNDNLLLRLTLAEHALGTGDASGHAALLASRYDAARERGDGLHRREEARFRLGVQGDAVAALELSRANWAVQHEPWDVRVLLAAAVAAHDPGVAAPALAFFRETHLQDPAIEALARALAATP